MICLSVDLFTFILVRIQFITIPECIGYCSSINLGRFGHQFSEYFSHSFLSPFFVVSIARMLVLLILELAWSVHLPSGLLLLPSQIISTTEPFP